MVAIEGKGEEKGRDALGFYAYVAEEWRPGDLVFLREGKRIDIYTEVGGLGSRQLNSSFHAVLLISQALNHGEGQVDEGEGLFDFGHVGVMVEGMLGEGGPPFLLGAGPAGLCCSDLEHCLLRAARQPRSVAVRRPRFLAAPDALTHSLTHSLTHLACLPA